MLKYTDRKNKLEALSTEVADKSITVASALVGADLQSMALELVAVRGKHDAIETWRKEVTGPIKQGIAAFEREVKPLLTTLEGMDDELVSALRQAEDADEEANKVLRAEAAALFESQPEEARRLVTVANAGRLPLPEGLRRSTTWVAIVEDADLLPEHLVERKANMTVLNKLARDYKGRHEVPGVRFEQRVTYTRAPSEKEET